METLLAIALAACGVALFSLASAARRQAQTRAWLRAAAALGLDDVRTEQDFSGAHLEGRADGLQLRLESYRRGRHEWGTRLVIRGLARLSLRRESAATAFEKRFLGETEIELGAPGFDDRCFVTGSPALACALLDARTRRALVSALEGRLPVEPHPLRVRVTLSEGTLRLECRGVWRTSSERVTRLLRGGLALARLLTLPADFPRRIASNLRDEPDPGVRLNALLTLAREYPNHPATRPALLAARQDEGAEIRLRAALALGEDGRETLLALVRGEQVEDGCAARAVAGLGEQLTEDEAIATLHRALDSGHSQTAIACLEALSARPSAMTEPALLMAFENAPTEARLAAVRALGRAGSTAAVSDLLAASETGPSALRAAARQAIAEIQSRLPGAGPGQLTLAAGEAGALTIPDDQPGALSLLDAEHGRSSPLETSEPAAADETQGRPPPSPPRLRTRE